MLVNNFMKFHHLDGQKSLTRKLSGTFIASNKISKEDLGNFIEIIVLHKYLHH